MGLLDLRTNSVLGSYGADGVPRGLRLEQDQLPAPTENILQLEQETGMFTFWNVQTGAVEGVLRSHTSAVYAVWHPAGHTFFFLRDKNKPAWLVRYVI